MARGGVASTIKARDYKDATDLVETQERVRRLTPRECARLQGFPDDWDIEGSDAAKYKMYGNAVALPCAVDVLARVKELYEMEEENK